MVCSSIIFIPGVMIYEFVKAWKATRISQNQVNECLIMIFIDDFFVKISNNMPHYLRMLTYASQPQDDWGPARKADQCGRYTAAIEPIDYNNKSFTIDSQIDMCSRL
jgi:hypothetical protein